MRPNKRYQEGGGVDDPPQGTITPQQALERLAQLQNVNQYGSLDSRGNVVYTKEERDALFPEGTPAAQQKQKDADAMFEFIRFMPVIGEALDLIETGKVNLTGKDLYGDDASAALHNSFLAAGLVIPNVLERPLRYLAKHGAKNFKDIRRVLYDNPDAPDLAPLKELEQKAKQFENRFSDRMLHATDLQAPYQMNSQARVQRAGTNYLLENDPDLLMKFTPEAYDQGMFDASMKDFADQYLTSYRGVDAPDAETAARYMTEIQKGGNAGGQMRGPGIYMGDIGVTRGYGDYVGAIRTAPDIGQYGNADDVARSLSNLEEYGGAIINLPIEERQILHDIGARPGMETYHNRGRVVRSAEAPNQKVLDVGLRGTFDPKYKSDYYGAVQGSNREIERGLETRIEQLLPFIEGYKKGGKVVKYKR